ncbi:MAG: hypothetical protein KKD46_02960 [Euryarchaeota archaeon]|nr:hypothetical protein [Euryarchaeota archaeon]
MSASGITHHTKAPSGSPVFSIAAAGALAGRRAFRSLDSGGGGTVGFGVGGGLGIVFL